MDYERNNASIRWAAVGFNGIGGPATRFDVAAVPEPGTWALMILGLGAAGAALRRRGAYARAW